MTKTYKLRDLDCANCAAKLERAVSKLDGVKSASVNFFAQKLTVEVPDENADVVLASVLKTSKKVEPDMTVIG